MIRYAALASAALSVAAHLAGVALTSAGEEARTAGGSPTEARLGNSFQDLAAGNVTAVPVRDRAIAVRSAAAPPVAEHVVAEPANPGATAPRVIVDTAPAADAPLRPGASEIAVAPAEPAETITGVEPPAPLDVSPRPRPRPDPEADKVAAAEPDAPPPSAAGATEAERRGATDGGSEAAAEPDSGQANAAPVAGNAAASNYPGTVMQKISRTRKPRVGARGTAVVGFEIASDGGLARIVILRSSGEAVVDQAAVEHLNRSAPFPPPPAGAERRFQVEYVSKG
jgi:periplasmic protein TonB